jgi:hypothetical protein
MSDSNFYNPIPNDSPFLTLVGLVATNWARVELVTDEAIWELLQVPPTVGACITSNIIGLSKRIDIVCALAGVRGVGDLKIKDFTGVANRHHELSKRRNRIVHDPWMEHFTTKEIAGVSISLDFKKKINMSMVSPSIVEIQNTADDIRRFEDLLWSKLEALLADLRSTTPGWQATAHMD